MRKRIIVAVALLPLAFVILFYLPPYVLAASLSIICALAAFELIHAAAGVKGNLRICIFALAVAALIPIGEYFNLNALIITTAMLTLMSLAFIEAIAGFKNNGEPSLTFTQILFILFGSLLIPYLLSTILILRLTYAGRLLVLLPVISAFVTDAGAYFVGSFLGKHKAFPLVSPKKTVEGCIGGIVFGTAAIVLCGVVIECFATQYFVNYWALLLYGGLGSVMSVLGDFAFSLIKRELDIKDFGRLLPEHGGALDRFDSMIFTAPTIYLLVIALPAVW